MCTLAIISVMAGSELQIVYDLEQQRGNIHYLSNLTRQSRNFGYALVHHDNANVTKPRLLPLTLFGFGMGPAFSSDIAGDGPRKRAVADDEYDPELLRIKRRKTYNARRSKASIKSNNLKRSKADRKADNLKQNQKRS